MQSSSTRRATSTNRATLRKTNSPSKHRQNQLAVSPVRSRTTAVNSSVKDSYSNTKLPYVQCIDGTLLFTAPHGLEVYRGGDKYSGEKKRLHSRERYSTELALKLAKYCSKYSSFMVWNYKTAKRKDPSNMDPNYLFKQQFSSSPWHMMLENWKKRHQTEFKTMFHIDVHGKMDRKKLGNKQYLDIGIQPMLSLWNDKKQVTTIRDTLSHRIQNVLDVYNSSDAPKKYLFYVDSDPQLHGYWGDDMMTTITHQSVLLGIAAIQFEIPFSLRTILMNNDTLFEAFANAILSTYNELFVTTSESTDSTLQNKKKVNMLQDMIKDLKNADEQNLIAEKQI
jgi:hypothetical protein